MRKDNEAAPANTYKVLFVLTEHDGYHWYRQNPDGTWSNKWGDSKVTNREVLTDYAVSSRELN